MTSSDDFTKKNNGNKLSKMPVCARFIIRHYGFEVSAETISNITNRVLVDVKEWQSRALKPKYAVVFMDGMVFKVKKEGVIKMHGVRVYRR